MKKVLENVLSGLQENRTEISNTYMGIFTEDNSAQDKETAIFITALTKFGGIANFRFKPVMSPPNGYF